MGRLQTLATIIAFSFATPSLAQDTTAGDGGTDDETKTLLAYLGLTAADGKNTVGEGAGSIEGHMLAAAMAMKAADTIVGKIETPVGGSVTQPAPVILLAGSEAMNLAEIDQAERQIKLLEQERRRLIKWADRTKCGEPLSDDQRGGPKGLWNENLLGISGVDLTASDLLGSARFSSSYSPVPVTLGTQLFKNAILARPSEKIAWILPSEIARPTWGEPLFNRYLEARNELTVYADGKCDARNPNIGKVAKEMIARADTLVVSKDGAPSLLDRAALAASVLHGAKDAKVLRVEIDKSGGTLVSSSNVWNSLGVPGITMRGGLVASYRLIDPTTGRTSASGIVLCRKPKTLLMSITQKAIDLDKIDCSPIELQATAATVSAIAPARTAP